MIRRIWRQIRSTAEIDPARFSPTTSPDRIRSFGYAVAGFVFMLRHQKNTRIQLAATVIVVTAAMWLGIDTDQWAILILAIGSVWVAEFINAALEATVNLSVTDFHPMARVAKDVAAAAVLLTAVVAVLIGFLILGPPLMERLHASAASS